MRYHGVPVAFRVHPDLVAALRQKAEERRMSPSEYLREVVRREVLEAA
ncbi:ribbon-helix-helix protein, CopG family [Sphingomonas tabacisoli]|uniref:Ribbon-helix-helix protein, CopG family n=1 Tax=Sphingomonas tabacisoli TaxID=2249466 RepID=A0ABW4I176_9SPHN